jgi:hypothetical protein
MMLESVLSVGFLDFILGRIFVQAEHLVIVFALAFLQLKFSVFEQLLVFCGQRSQTHKL